MIRLNATATQTGTTTGFNANARLANGSDIAVAGTLAPVDGGYRLGLDRAELEQGALAARLAAPTVLSVAGSTVSLDAVKLNVGAGSVTASGTAGEALDIGLDINALPLVIANAVMPELGLAGTLSGNATISGLSSAPQVTFTADANGINAAAIGDYGIAPLHASVSGSYADNVVTLAALRADGTGGCRYRAPAPYP
ncbi:hypothetical protein PSQ19_09325 [Devosia algicola]|uniref:Uncharacterized protein n=1 Tax=Devosia algicola TaxID=3026418 RepID=A0ABY7YSJ8_9HYPH|nr:hypothetical protein [Devosia algicola]WDR04167.1 hypothetical protein PSQ19_09325 [Devosia algicola]